MAAFLGTLAKLGGGLATGGKAVGQAYLRAGKKRFRDARKQFTFGQQDEDQNNTFGFVPPENSGAEYYPPY